MGWMCRVLKGVKLISTIFIEWILCNCTWRIYTRGDNKWAYKLMPVIWDFWVQGWGYQKEYTSTPKSSKMSSVFKDIKGRAGLGKVQKT